MEVLISSITESITEYASSLISSYDYFGVFIAMFLETIFPIIPSEIILLSAGFILHNNHEAMIEIIRVIVFATMGSTVGSLIIYLISRKVGKVVVIKFGKYLLFDIKKLEKLEKWFDKYGSIMVFVSRMIPGLRELISIPAGLSSMNVYKYTLLTFFGSLLWCSFLIGVGIYFGNLVTDDIITEFKNFSNYIAIAIILIILGYIIYKVIKK